MAVRCGRQYSPTCLHRVSQRHTTVRTRCPVPWRMAEDSEITPLPTHPPTHASSSLVCFPCLQRLAEEFESRTDSMSTKVQVSLALLYCLAVQYFSAVLPSGLPISNASERRRSV